MTGPGPNPSHDPLDVIAHRWAAEGVTAMIAVHEVAANAIRDVPKLIAMLHEARAEVAALRKLVAEQSAPDARSAQPGHPE